MHVNFDQLWDVVKWVTLIVVYPSMKFIWGHVSGKRKRRLDALDDMLEKVTSLTIQNARLLEDMGGLRKLHMEQGTKLAGLTIQNERLLEDMTVLRKSNVELRAEVADLHAEIETLRPTRKT